jgi:hypothetical protein
VRASRHGYWSGNFREDFSRTRRDSTMVRRRLVHSGLDAVWDLRPYSGRDYFYLAHRNSRPAVAGMDSYWQINAGFGQIWPRQFPSFCFPAYTYILWLSTKIIGTSEIALKIPSLLAMLGQPICCICAARELFERDNCPCRSYSFCAHPTVVPRALRVN